MERQLVFGLNEILGIEYFCPACLPKKRTLVKSMHDVEVSAASAPGNLFCADCLSTSRDGPVAKLSEDAAFRQHFKNLADLLQGKTRLGEWNVRLIVSEGTTGS